MRYQFNPTKRPEKKLVCVTQYLVEEAELNYAEFMRIFDSEDEAKEFIRENGSPGLGYSEVKRYMWL